MSHRDSVHGMKRCQECKKVLVVGYGHKGECPGIVLTKAQRGWLDCLIALGTLATSDVYGHAARSFAALEKLRLVEVIDFGGHNAYAPTNLGRSVHAKTNG